MAEWSNVWLIPTLAVLFGYAALFVSYGIGVGNGHIPAVLPFISDGGAFPPEGCLFSQFLNMSAFFLVLTVYIRHRQVVEYYGNRLRRHDVWWRRCSFALAFVGISSAIAITAVASFAETEVLSVHAVAATVAFFLGLVYVWGHIILSFVLSPRMTTPCVNFIRVFIAIIATAGLILHETALNSSLFLPSNVPSPKISSYTPQFLDPSSPVRTFMYYLRHTVAAGAEWIMVLFFFLFVLTFTAELWHTYVRPPRVFFRKTRTDRLNRVEDDEVIHF